MTENNSKPCLVQTPQGFSVSYKERFLYSKYNPEKSILQTINNLNIQEDTLILCCSPVLSYGINELAEKLPSNSHFLVCEADTELYNFHCAQIKNLPPSAIRLTPQELFSLPQILQQTKYTTQNGQIFFPAGNFRRVQRIDFSAGVQFHQDFYTQLQNSCINSVKTYWTNRITLTRFGRKYSRNFFINLQKLPQTTPIETFFNSINKTIVVCGAGESLNDSISQIQQNRNEYFVICVDTALSPLVKSKIIPDAVFVEEAQSVIAKAFIGAIKKETQLFCGLSSLPSLTRFFSQEKISFFTTLYTNASFINRMKENHVLPSQNVPLGSVGLTAVEYALKFRSNDNTPVYVCGLDFSYSTGVTHAKGAMAHIQRLFTSNRINPVENYNASYSAGTETFFDKNGNKMITSVNLKNYALLFQDRFSKTPNLFDFTKKGFSLELPYKTLEPNKNLKQNINIQNEIKCEWTKESIKDFIFNEKEALTQLRDILSGKIALSEQEQTEKITDLASQREYLYLHFPDGNKFSTSLSFLKRIRAEIDFFLKYLE